MSKDITFALEFIHFSLLQKTITSPRQRYPSLILHRNNTGGINISIQRDRIYILGFQALLDLISVTNQLST